MPRDLFFSFPDKPFTIILSQKQQHFPPRLCISKVTHHLCWSLLGRDDHGFSPLHWACREGRSSVVDMLIMRGARINVMNRGDDTPLHLAASHGHRDIVGKVVSCGVASLLIFPIIRYFPWRKVSIFCITCWFSLWKTNLFHRFHWWRRSPWVTRWQMVSGLLHRLRTFWNL